MLNLLCHRGFGNGQFESSNPLDATIGGGLAGKAEHGSVGGRGHDLDRFS